MLAAATPAASAKSPLADAAEKLDRASIRTLLKQHADVNAPQADGITALHWAAYLDDFETAKVLVDATANVHYAFQLVTSVPFHLNRVRSLRRERLGALSVSLSDA